MVASNLNFHHARNRQYPNINIHLSAQRKFTISTSKQPTRETVQQTVLRQLM